MAIISWFLFLSGMFWGYFWCIIGFLGVIMKDLLIVTIAGTLLWWVAVYPEDCIADVKFDNNTAWVLITVFSF